MLCHANLDTGEKDPNIQACPVQFPIVLLRFPTFNFFISTNLYITNKTDFLSCVDKPAWLAQFNHIGSVIQSSIMSTYTCAATAGCHTQKQTQWQVCSIC